MRRILNFMLDWKSCLLVIIILLFVVGIQAGIRKGIDSSSTAQPKATCTFAGWNYRGNLVYMNLHCGPREAWTNDAKFITKYLQQPSGGAFICNVSKTNAAEDCSYTSPK